MFEIQINFAYKYKRVLMLQDTFSISFLQQLGIFIFISIVPDLEFILKYEELLYPRESNSSGQCLIHVSAYFVLSNLPGSPPVPNASSAITTTVNRACCCCFVTTILLPLLYTEPTACYCHLLFPTVCSLQFFLTIASM